MCYHIYMRVIAGKYRGKKLQEFDLSTTKPTLDRVKEGLFSSIQFDIIDAKVLDLFAGTGGLGIECLSRGASEVTFVDDSPKAIEIINKNLKGIEGNFKVVYEDYINFLMQARSKHNQYDIILLDPPFNTDYGVKTINYILNNNLLSEGGIIMYEHLYDNAFKLNYPNYNFKQKKYGTVGVVKITKCNIQN